MSRHIDLSRPLSEDEKAYLLARAREGEVTVNERRFGGLSDDERKALRERAAKDARREEAIAVLNETDDDEDDFDDDVLAQVMPLKVAELRDRLEKEDLPNDGNKDELQLRLLVFLQDKKDGKI